MRNLANVEPASRMRVAEYFANSAMPNPHYEEAYKRRGHMTLLGLAALADLHDPGTDESDDYELLAELEVPGGPNMLWIINCLI